jgi:Phosphatidylinositol transfer protein
MPELVEYRIPFPATIEEFLIAQQYMIQRASREETRRAGGGGAVDVVRHELFAGNEHGLGSGIYTEKVFHIRRFLPRFLRPLVPPASSKLVEKSWASYPNRCLTLYFCPYFGSKSFMSIESRYLADRGETQNALNLSTDELAERQVIMLDIASEDKLRMAADADVREFRSAKCGRGALVSGVWTREHDPIMCCYKVCRLNISAPRIETFAQRYLQNSFIRYNRQAFVWIDSWFSLGLADIPGALPKTRMQLESAQVVVATELSTDVPLDVGAATDLFDSSDHSNPFA